MMDGGDTIAAVATAAGRGALAVVRMSGPAAWSIADACLTPHLSAPRRVQRVRVHAPGTADIVDDALAIGYRAPASYTGEDLVEVIGHGGHVSPAAVLAAFVRAGARPAAPGEFTRRAVLSGKLDLVQAEAVGDVVDARSSFSQRAALMQLSGALTRSIAGTRDTLLELEGLLAYDVDFPNEDDGPIARARVTAAATDARAAIGRLLATLPAARMGAEGAVVVLAGVPNAGKSSLFNALLGEARAIVTEYPGTTRDAIDALVDAEPYPWRIVDTAGLRDAVDPIERLGVEASAEWLGRADVVLVCGSTRKAREHASGVVRARTGAAMILVHTMADLGGDASGSDVQVSAVTGSGLTEARAQIAGALVTRTPTPPADVPVVSRARHARALEVADAELAAFIAGWVTDELPSTVLAVHIRTAVHVLEELIGGVNADDVLARVFERFCVGK